MWLTVVGIHAAGAVLSAATLGFALGTLGLVFSFGNAPTERALVDVIVFLCVLRDIGVWRWPLLSLHRQVPSWFPRMLGWRWGAFAWGVDLGQGWTTQITFAGYYAVALWAVVYADPIRGTLMFAAYGLGRASSLVAVGLVKGGAEHDLDALLAIRFTNLTVLQYTVAAAIAVTGGFLAA